MNSNRYQYIDAIRVVGMFFVILLHSCVEKLRINIGTFGWHVVNFITSLATIAVPLFFMASGAVILASKSTEDYKYVLKKRIPKMFLPLLIWSALSLVSDFIIGTSNGIENINEIVLAKAKTFMVSPVRIHFWFMYTLIPLYIISPILKSSIQNRQTLKYAAALFFVISFLGSGVLLLPADYAFILNITFIRGAAFGSYIYYFLLGYLLHTSSKRFDTHVLVAATAVIWIIISAGTYWKSSDGIYSEIFKSYIGIFCLILSCLVFMLFKNLCIKPNPFVKALAPLSFGVYLIHNILIAIWQSLLPTTEITSSIKYVALCFIATSVVSCAVIWVLSKSKITSYLFCGNTYKIKER